MKLRTYSELVRLETFDERLKYLMLNGSVGEDTFGSFRFINQDWYRSSVWKNVRDIVIIRDNGCDLGIEGMEITDKIFVHHMNPLSLDNIDSEDAFNPEYLITTNLNTHNAIHYGYQLHIEKMVDRKPNDTCLWRLK